MIGQTFERYVAATGACDQHKVIQSHQKEEEWNPLVGFDLIKALFPAKVGAFLHVLALELPQLSK